MNARRRPARVLLLAAAAILLAGCASVPATTPLASVTSETPPDSTPAPGASPAALPTASPEPTLIPGCPDIDSVNLAGIEVTLGSVDEDGNGGGGISVGRTYTGLEVTRVTERSGAQRSMTPPTQGVFDEGGQILGGQELVAFPFTTFDGHVNPQAMIAASVTLTLDGSAPSALPTRFIPGNENFDQVAVAVPDVAGRGTMSFEFVWADTCFRYEGSHTIVVDVVPLSATSGCALSWAGYFDQVGDLLRESIRVGSVLPRAFSPLNKAKYALFESEGIDAFLVYGFDPNGPTISAAPGSLLRIERASPDITLRDDMALWVWTRASVARAVKDYPPDGTVLVLSRTPEQQADGSFRLRVPQAAGRYVAGVQLAYDSDCSSGTLWFVVNVDVVAP